MEIWNKLQIIINYNLTFTKIKKGYNVYPETTGKLYFYDKDGGTRGGGYIDLYTSTCYYKPSGDVPYTVTRLSDSSTFVEFANPMTLGTYDEVNTCFNYLFWSDDVNNSAGGGGDGEIVTKEHTEYRMRQKEQVKPTDDSQDWADTGNYRDDPEFDVIVDGCQCSREFQWVEDGVLCDGTNKCIKYKLQYKNSCSAKWEDYDPVKYMIGEIIETDSSECGTHEYKEEWDDTPYCGSELNKKYGYNLIPTNKYILLFAYVKRIDSDTWELVNCERPLDYKTYKANSFECGWIGKKTETFFERDLCGNDVIEKYPSITGISATTKYDVKTNHNYETLPYPTNTDEMEESEWVWRETGITYEAVVVEKESCDCGYYYLQWDETDEYICGSKLGAGYNNTSQYRKYEENKYCDGILLEPSGKYEWRLYDSQSCECGYRVSGGPEIDASVGYEYICGDVIDSLEDNYMYYKEYYYTECVDGSNKVYDKENNVHYVKTTHSTSSVTTCILDEELQANTTKVETIYRTYLDKNTNVYFVVNCNGEDYVEKTIVTERSEDCGYKERWTTSGTVCCGNLENENPIEFSILSTTGDWTRSDYQFTSNPIDHNQSTIMNIEFSISVECDIVINYDISSESYDKFYYQVYDMDYTGTTDPSLGGASGTKKGEYRVRNVKSGNHILSLKYRKDYSGVNGRDNVIVTISADRGLCNKYSKYEAQYFEYSVDGGENWKQPEPSEWRYGGLIEAQSEECGYIPKLTQWKLLCPDVTADDYQTPEDLDECVECHSHQNAPSLFAIEYEQISTDGGATWKDTGKTRTEKLLKWKSKACGYTGDIFETRWTNEYCNGKDLFGTKSIWVSSDNGDTWTEVEGSATIELKEENSPQCQGEEGGA